MSVLSERAVKSPKLFVWLPALLSMLVILMVVIPTVSPIVAKYLHPLTIDVDPENMLFEDDPERVFHRQQKQVFDINDLIIVGVVNKQDENGVFNIDSLSNIYDLTEFAKNIQWPSKDDAQTVEGVIAVDLISPSTVDNISQGDPGTVKFDWLMSAAPTTDEEALAVREKARNQPLLNGSLLSEDGQALALYIPITSKTISYRITSILQERIDSYAGDDEFYISGLPVAQDTFGVEMFIQMGITTPIAMTLIFLLLWYFFGNVRLIISPLLVAMASVTLTIGLLVISGNNIHIMSSMIPIFIMPIAILDAIHILSEFYDKYPDFKDRKKTIKHVMRELSKPMLFTTITTAVGFFSLNLTPLPPIQVFGTFIGLGVIIAWFFTITFIPAYILLMPESNFSDFGIKKEVAQEDKKINLFARVLGATGAWSHRHAKAVLIITTLILGGSIYGASKIEANDNIVKWFEEGHKIRIADKALNEMFAGTYMSYLSLRSDETEQSYEDFVSETEVKLSNHDSSMLGSLAEGINELALQAQTSEQLMNLLVEKLELQTEDESLDDYLALEKELLILGPMSQVFKDPQVLNYIAGLQSYLLETGYVGKSNSVVEIVKTVHRELFSGDENEYRIPATATAVAQTLITFQNSHRPHDLWRFVTPDYLQANVWLQLKSGDNQDMIKLESAVADYFVNNPAPRELQHQWFGLNHINVTWQEQIVIGMATALAGSFVVVLLMMVFLFRSLLWALLAMIPLSFSIAVLYGIIGFMGKDYDAPIAILSALILGLTVDYAIHFLSRTRVLYKEFQNWPDTIVAVYGEPARAISRNVIIMGVGFLPLLLAPLVPYKDVGMFISSILVFAGVATLIILPALISLLQGFLFKTEGNETEINLKTEVN
ncbi:MAG: RND transporter [SAR86 cluster bacterium]|uniref:RND transporter n=1 Tax=SAR86 cluster bacterium TaxID=2030880 RepID=A0A2A4MQN6_9GAMM|nr:MAG: RND transporter [SAR86 cluster bacterium]